MEGRVHPWHVWGGSRATGGDVNVDVGVRVRRGVARCVVDGATRLVLAKEGEVLGERALLEPRLHVRAVGAVGRHAEERHGAVVVARLGLDPLRDVVGRLVARADLEAHLLQVVDGHLGEDVEVDLVLGEGGRVAASSEVGGNRRGGQSKGGWWNGEWGRCEEGRWSRVVSTRVRARTRTGRASRATTWCPGPPATHRTSDDESEGPCTCACVRGGRSGPRRVADGCDRPLMRARCAPAGRICESPRRVRRERAWRRVEDTLAYCGGCGNAVF